MSIEWIAVDAVFYHCKYKPLNSSYYLGVDGGESSESEWGRSTGSCGSVLCPSNRQYGCSSICRTGFNIEFYTKNSENEAKCLKVFENTVQKYPFCDHFKQNSPFSCSRMPSGTLPTTQAAAITWYKTNYPAKTICEPLKKNAPFRCTGRFPIPLLT